MPCGSLHATSYPVPCCGSASSSCASVTPLLYLWLVPDVQDTTSSFLLAFQKWASNSTEYQLLESVTVSVSPTAQPYTEEVKGHVHVMEKWRKLVRTKAGDLWLSMSVRLPFSTFPYPSGSLSQIASQIYISQTHRLPSCPPLSCSYNNSACVCTSVMGAHVYKCVCACTHTCAHICTCGGQRTILGVSLGQGLSWPEADQWPPRILCLCVVPGVLVCITIPRFYVGAADWIDILMLQHFSAWSISPVLVKKSSLSSLSSSLSPHHHFYYIPTV